MSAADGPKRFEVDRPDGRTVVAYDSGAGPQAPVLVWHHGSPQTGAPLEPVIAAARERGIRIISYARPSYGGSSGQPGRSVADAAEDVAAVLDARDVERFTVMGASGGGPHALACAALLGERVSAAVTLAGIAPLPTGSDDFDFFRGMQAPGGLRAALGGRASRRAYAESDEFDPEQFIAADYAALAGGWSALGDDVGRAAEWGDDGLIDDDVAFTSPWGFELGRIEVPVLIVQGALDRVVPATHAEHLHQLVAHSELRLHPDDGHVSVLDAVPAVMDWLLLN